MEYSKLYASWKVSENKVGIVWLGQAGFLIKTPSGKTIMIDPYLTDYTHKSLGDDGFIRMTAPLFLPGELHADYLFSSHHHADHWDLDALPNLMEEGTKCFANEDSVNVATKYGVDMHSVITIKAGDVLQFEEFTVYVLRCDHGKTTPNAMGFMFDFGYTKVYYSGDTCLNLELLAPAIAMKPEVSLLPINGAYGNLNAVDAAILAERLGSKYCIPHHFWTFPNHNEVLGDPKSALKYFPFIAPACKLALVTPGEMKEY